MTPPDSPPTPEDESAFEARLTNLVDSARDAKIPVQGAYVVRSPQPDTPDFTIEITEIAKRTFLDEND